MTLLAESIPSPIGPLHVVLCGEAVCALSFADYLSHERAWLARRFPGSTIVEGDTGRVGAALRRYLDGDLAAIDGLAVDPGGTPFQARVWTALRGIPPGRTRSYAELARALGEPSAVRAVAAANARNPIAIVVPCHRVIGSDGRLTGYGGGLERKAWLLRHEGVTPHASAPLPLFA